MTRRRLHIGSPRERGAALRLVHRLFGVTPGQLARCKRVTRPDIVAVERGLGTGLHDATWRALFTHAVRYTSVLPPYELNSVPPELRASTPTPASAPGRATALANLDLGALVDGLRESGLVASNDRPGSRGYNDLIRLAAERAVEAFAPSDTIFNAAGFSNAFLQLAGVVGTSLDGRVVRAMLAGRPDIEVLPGYVHFRLLTRRPHGKGARSNGT